MKFYQACFGKPNNVNWSLFNTSADIPTNMISFYERAENGNTPQNLNNDDMVDANGNPVCIKEVLSQDGVIAISKIQYGSKDNMGRAAMVSHGYLFSIEDGILNDPNNILAIADSNFKFTVDETKDIPAELVYNEPFALRSSFEACGLSLESIVKLLSCVYVSITSATDFPIYVYSKKSNEIMLPLMYCLYRFLPYSLRYHISFSNGNNLAKSQKTSLMFVDKKYDGMYYFDTETGETNIDLSELENHKDNYPFFHKLSDIGAKDFESYCEALQNELNGMQMSHSTDYNILKLADVFVKGAAYAEGMNDQDLTRFLLETLGYAPMQNEYIDSKLAGFLNEFFNRGLLPNEAFMRRVQIRSEKTPSQDFVTIYKQLQMKFLSGQGESAVIAFLVEQRKASEERFVDWRHYISNLSEGSILLEGYYAHIAHTATSFDALEKVINECPDNAYGVRVLAAADEQCKKIIRAQFNDNDSVADAFTKILDRYKRFFTALHPSDSQKFYDILDEENEVYWKGFDIAKFDFDKAKINNFMSLDSSKSPMSLFVKMLINIYDRMEGNTKEPYQPMTFAEEAIQTIDNCDALTEQQWAVIVPVIQEYFMKKLPTDVYRSQSFMFWYKLASLKTKANPYSKMLEWNISVLTDEGAFAEVIREELDPDQIEKLIDELDGDDCNGLLDNGDFEKNSDEYKLLKKRLGALQEVSKSIRKQRKADEKAEEAMRAKALKEERERQKAAEKESKKSAAPQKQGKMFSQQSAPAPEKKGNIFSNLFGGNSKKK